MRRVKEKGVEALRVISPTATRPTDALIGDEEQTGKKEERNGERASNPTTPDHSIASYDQ